jgi:hypothetical protein
MNASGQFPVNLTNAPGEDIQPAWQPVRHCALKTNRPPQTGDLQFYS